MCRDEAVHTFILGSTCMWWQKNIKRQTDRQTDKPTDRQADKTDMFNFSNPRRACVLRVVNIILYNYILE